MCHFKFYSERERQDQSKFEAVTVYVANSTQASSTKQESRLLQLEKFKSCKETAGYFTNWGKVDIIIFSNSWMYPDKHAAGAQGYIGAVLANQKDPQPQAKGKRKQGALTSQSGKRVFKWCIKIHPLLFTNKNWIVARIELTNYATPNKQHSFHCRDASITCTMRMWWH